MAILVTLKLSSVLVILRLVLISRSQNHFTTNKSFSAASSSSPINPVTQTPARGKAARIAAVHPDQDLSQLDLFGSTISLNEIEDFPSQFN